MDIITDADFMELVSKQMLPLIHEPLLCALCDEDYYRDRKVKCHKLLDVTNAIAEHLHRISDPNLLQVSLKFFIIATFEGSSHQKACLHCDSSIRFLSSKILPFLLMIWFEHLVFCILTKFFNCHSSLRYPPTLLEIAHTLSCFNGQKYAHLLIEVLHYIIREKYLAGNHSMFFSDIVDLTIAFGFQFPA